MVVVTCFSQKGYEETGRKSLQTFVENWPCKIIAYYEEKEPDFKHPNIEYRPFFLIPGVVGFLEYLMSIPQANGVVTQNGKERYNYNYDIWKFCRKMFAQYDVLGSEKGKVFWLDNDVITKKPVPEEFLEELFYDYSEDDRREYSEALVYLGRKGFHSETGFVGFDTEHKDFPKFLDRYIKVLKQGIIFSLPRWHDCEAFDWAREGKGKDLSPFWKQGDPLGVWNKTVLNEYMDHFKGQRKYLVNETVETIQEDAPEQEELQRKVAQTTRRKNQSLH